jgi:autotransporter-associated beta strand protein
LGYTLHTFNSTGAVALNALAATFSGTIGGTGSFVANPSAGGEFTFTQNNTYSGGTTLSAGTLKVGTGGATGTLGLPTATGTVTNNGALIFNHTNSVSYAAPFAGTGTLSVTAAGGLTLTGAATYTGLTTVTSSSITYTNNTIPSTSGFAGAGFVTIQPAIGGTYASAHTANYTFANTLTGLTWGHSTNTANITLNTAIGIAGPISVYGGAITVNQNLNTSTAATASAVMLKGQGNVSLASGKSITTNGGAVTFWADSDGNGTGYVQMLASSSVATSGGAITLGGGTDITTGYAIGEATRDQVTDASNIYYISGVNLQSGTSLTSGGGDVTLRGQNSGGSAAALSYGVMGGGVTIDSGIGKISITGKATGSAGINAQAVSYYGTGFTLRSANTTSQAISIVGDASGVSGTNSSLGINFSGSMEATGTGGGISITGTSGTATGVDVATNLGGNILAASGPINIVGINEGQSDFQPPIVVTNVPLTIPASTIAAASAPQVAPAAATRLEAPRDTAPAGALSAMPVAVARSRLPPVPEARESAGA